MKLKLPHCKCGHSGESHNKTLKYAKGKYVIALEHCCRRANCKCKSLELRGSK